MIDLAAAPRPVSAAAPRAWTSAPARVAAGFLGGGVLACAMAAAAGAADNAERFAYPREIVLHLAAAAAAALTLLGARRIRADHADLLLGVFTLLGVVSGLAVSVNPAYALRATGISVSAALVFWTARTLSEGDVGRSASFTRMAALAAVVVAVTALLDAYGVLDLSLAGRAPGGLFGNRNRMAHFVALGLPVAMLHAARARGTRALGWTAALAAMAAAVTLSRSRAAWLALGVAGVLVAAAGLLYLRGALRARGGPRAALLAAALAAGVAAAVVLPNTLEWRSSSPYYDSLVGLVEAGSGSGRTRLVQYANTLRMAAAHPVLGVGPGNWTIQYPRYSREGDPSFNPRARVPTNRLPHGDWAGFAAERGFPALLALASFLFLALRGALRSAAAPRAHAEGQDEAVRRGLGALALLGTVLVLCVAGTFDPVLMTPAPAFLAFLVLGALMPRETPVLSRPLAPAVRTVSLVLLLLLTPRLVVHSGRQLWADSLYDTRSGPAALERAVRISPDDYTARMLLAEARVREGRCDRAAPHMVAAFRLFPTAVAPVRLMVRCQRALEAAGGAGIDVPSLPLPAPGAPGGMAPAP